MFGSHKPGPEREDKANAQPLYAGTHKTATPAGLTKALTVIGLAVLLFGARAFGAETSILDAYPGRLVSIGTHSIHLDCRGNGQPTIVLESGIGGFSLEWHAVQSALAAHTRVCAYDRAGYGPSQGHRSYGNHRNQGVFQDMLVDHHQMGHSLGNRSGDKLLLFDLTHR